jgi:hypothetical protein
MAIWMVLIVLSVVLGWWPQQLCTVQLKPDLAQHVVHRLSLQAARAGNAASIQSLKHFVRLQVVH